MNFELSPHAVFLISERVESAISEREARSSPILPPVRFFFLFHTRARAPSGLVPRRASLSSPVTLASAGKHAWLSRLSTSSGGSLVPRSTHLPTT